MCSHDIPVQYLRLETQLAALINGDSFLQDLLTTGGINGITLCLLFMEGFTTAISCWGIATIYLTHIAVRKEV